MLGQQRRNQHLMFTILSVWLSFSDIQWSRFTDIESDNTKRNNNKRQENHNLLFFRGNAFRCAHKSPWIWLPSQSWWRTTENRYANSMLAASSSSKPCNEPEDT